MGRTVIRSLDRPISAGVAQLGGLVTNVERRIDAFSRVNDADFADAGGNTSEMVVILCALMFEHGALGV